MKKLDEFSTRYLDDFQAYLLASAEAATSGPGTLRDAMLYSLSSGGKRFRPLLLFAAVEVCGGKVREAFPVAAALEWIHTYSLIHDDLPAMDNDDYRRGNLTAHKQFNEAAAILAGDALLTAAFSFLLEQEYLPPEKRVLLARALAEASGPKGMVAGQMDDIEGESQVLTIEELQAIHKRKTGALIEYAVFAGCQLADAESMIAQTLQQYAQHIGLAFQIHNDLKDVTLDEKGTGKTVGKDEALEKNTYPSLLGIKGAKEALQDEKRQAASLLKTLEEADSSTINKPSISILIELMDYLNI